MTGSSEGIIIDGDAFAQDVLRFSVLTGKSFAEEMKVQAKGVMKEIVKITPPFVNGDGVARAKRVGENAISRDLTRVFRGVNLVGSRQITHLFGKPHPDAPWTTPTTEQHPQVTSLYAAHKKLDSKSRHARYEKPLFVDKMKLDTLRKRLEKRVGFLGGGFAMAAAGLGVPLPAFMKRHAGAAPGSLTMHLEGDELYIIISNEVQYGTRVEGFARRVEWALQTQRGKMERQMPYLLKRYERLLN